MLKIRLGHPEKSCARIFSALLQNQNSVYSSCSLWNMAKGHYTEYSKWLLEDFGDIRKFFVRGRSVCWKYDVAEKRTVLWR